MSDDGEAPDRYATMLHSLRHARGRYPVERAAQLSGIPRSTLYDWNRHGVYVPDFAAGSPMAWSYRDLVFVRVLAWLRNDVKTPRSVASVRVQALKVHISAGHLVTMLHADRDSLVVDGNVAAPLDGPSRMFVDMLASFDLASAVDDFGAHTKLWGPDLVAPSAHTYISPWVLGGDPCVAKTRIPSASIYSLRVDRGLSVADVVALYPGLSESAANDAFTLETRLRGHQPQAA